MTEPQFFTFLDVFCDIFIFRDVLSFLTGLDVCFFLIENIMVRTLLLLIVVRPTKLVCSLLKGSCVRGLLQWPFL